MIRILVLILSFTAAALAQLSPGDLSRPHAGLEGLENCQKCHAMEQQISKEKCLECHTILGEQIKAGKGLHSGRGYEKCQTCHAEHNGRDFDLIWWPEGMEKFDHAKTGYKLQGKHTALQCRQCHQEKNIADKSRLQKNKKNLQRTFLGLTEKCTGCHIDPHKGQFAQTCETCHSMDHWKPVQTFDHQKTGFPLTGSHQKVRCANCHPVNDKNEMRFKPISHDACTDCHKDVHQNRFGQNCTKCHTTTGWRGQPKSGFNHDMTRYPLRGAHQRVTCKSCHLPGKPLKGLSFNSCRDCHQDFHRGAFAKDASKGACQACHTVEGFSPSLFSVAEHQKSDYPLSGAHLAVPCIACHKSGDGPWRFSFANRDCQVCHVNPHGEEARRASAANPDKGCAFCHGFESWPDVTFDHSATGFSLEGRHAAIKCSDCHKRSGSGMLRFSGLKRDCQTCHLDAHQGQLRTKTGVDCSRCHSPKDWLADKFIHNRDSRFRIEGAHRYIACGKCHPTVAEKGLKFIRYKPLDVTCAACHADQKSLKE